MPAMYRGTEDEALANAVIEAASKRDPAAALSAARELWLAIPQLPPGQPDHWEDKAWHALVAAGLLFEAVAAGVELIRAGKQLRLAAFVHIVQHVGGAYVTQDSSEASRTTTREVSEAESKVLLEILHLARKGTYPDDGYSAVVFNRFFEGKGKRFVWLYLEENQAELAKSRINWQMLGLIKHAFDNDATAWWGRWHEHADAEMWTVMLLIASLRHPYGRADPEALAAHCEAALERMAPDESERLLRCVQLESLLLRGRNDEFLAGLERHAALLRLDVTSDSSIVWRPIMRFVNQFRDKARLGGTNVEEKGTTGREIAVRVMLGPLGGALYQGPDTLDSVIGELCFDLQSYELAALRAFALFRKLLGTSDKDAVVELTDEFYALEKATWIVPMRELWMATMRRKLPWSMRLKRMFF